MACSKCKKERCGCDSAIPMAPNFSNNPEACPPDSEPCSEVFDMNCISYTGSDICELDIKSGDRLNEVLQKLILTVAQITCDPAGLVPNGMTVGSGVPSGAPTNNNIYWLDCDTGVWYLWNGSSWVSVCASQMVQTFTVLSPNTEGIWLFFTEVITQGSTTVGDIGFAVDRVGCADDITLTINSPDGLTFIGGSPTFVIPAAFSQLVTTIEVPPGLLPGTYNFTIDWTACGTTRTQNGELVINP